MVIESTSRRQTAPLRIAMVSTPWFEVPPAGYGGIEAICHTLAEGLIQRGHEVTLIGAGTDHESAGFFPTFTEPADGLGTGESVTVEGVHALRATRYILEMERVDVVQSLGARARLWQTVTGCRRWSRHTVPSRA